MDELVADLAAVAEAMTGRAGNPPEGQALGPSSSSSPGADGSASPPPSSGRLF